VDHPVGGGGAGPDGSPLATIAETLPPAYDLTIIP